MSGDILEQIRSAGIEVIPVGSRVTCNPPPTDTDADYLVLCDSEQHGWLHELLDSENFRFTGSRVADAVNYIRETDRFESYKAGEINLIITRSPEFHRKFLAASHVAKRLNLLNKADRIALFQAVLYGNSWMPAAEVEAALDAIDGGPIGGAA
jgi:hypothetical protein